MGFGFSFWTAERLHCWENPRGCGGWRRQRKRSDGRPWTQVPLLVLTDTLDFVSWLPGSHLLLFPVFPGWKDAQPHGPGLDHEGAGVPRNSFSRATNGPEGVGGSQESRTRTTVLQRKERNPEFSPDSNLQRSWHFLTQWWSAEPHSPLWLSLARPGSNSPRSWRSQTNVRKLTEGDYGRL